VSSDERPDSLAAQAAAWVPPWERPHRPPDRDYQAATTGPDASDDLSAETLDGDDFDESFEGEDPPGDSDVPPELPPLPGESGGPATVDAPAEVPGETPPEATDVGNEPELPLPEPIEAAEAEAEDDELGLAVDAPLPAQEENAVDAALAFAAGQADAEAALGSGPASAEQADARSAVPVQGRQTHRPGAAGGAAQGRTGDGSSELASADDEPARAGDALAAMDDAELRAALEAILLVVDEPVAEMQLAQIVEQPTERVAVMLEDISARYTAAGHGFDLRRAAGGWRLYTRPEYAPYVERFVLDGQSVRLTQASLETLAVVAYKQPVTRSRISAIRGVNCDGVMRTLMTRGLIAECGIEDETGAYLYRTTPLFLEKLGLNSVDQLPPLAPFLPDDVEEVLDAPG
jgi:segregation and condensation protein B